jgi:hypothetical protein
MAHKSDVQKAMFRKEVGQIDFLWGTPGNKANDFKGGWGISHVLAKHGARDAMKLPHVLAKGKAIKIKDFGDERVEISLHGFSAYLIKENSRKAWVLSGYTNRR